MNMKKIVATASALSLTAAIAVGGTLAWLNAKTETVTNTFTVGQVSIKLQEKEIGKETFLDATTTEQSQTYKVSPGVAVTKEADVVVNQNSEASYVFVKVMPSNAFNTNFDWEMDDAWIELSDVDNVYYQEVEATTDSATTLTILKNDRVTPKGTIENLSDATLVFQAYAIQSDGIDDANTAWTNLNVGA